MRLHQSSLRGILGFCQGRLVFFGGGGLLAGVSAVFLVGILGAMLLPSVPERAQAVEGDGGATTYATGASVSLGVPATIDFEAVTPTANGATTTATANVTVATTNSAGYSLYLYAEGGNNLVAQNPATAEVVTATASSATLDGLANNTWGYNLGTAATGTGTTYAAVPTDGTTPVQTKDTSSTNAANDTYTLALGAKVDTTIPSGTYTGALTVAVVAEPGGIVINYDANGGIFGDNDTNSVSYNVKEISTQSINNGNSTNYDETISIPGATSLTIDFTCYAAKMGNVRLYDGAGNVIVACSQMTVDPDVHPSASGTYIISGDSLRIYLFDDGTGSYFNAEATGYEITPISGTEELTPTRSGYNFAGWYTDAAGTEGNEFVPNGNMVSGTTVYAKWEEAPVMQNFTNSQCQSLASDAPYIVKDSRDGNTYTVRYINGACWMTQNLRLSGGRTLTSVDSNVASSWYFPNTSLGGSESYTEPRSVISANVSYGGYYNLCAASAGTICQVVNENITYDICPSGWRLPAENEASTITGSSLSSIFSPVLSGYYDSGEKRYYGVGSDDYWWTATASDSYHQFYLNYYDGYLSPSDLDYGTKSNGLALRCIRSD